MIWIPAGMLLAAAAAALILRQFMGNPHLQELGFAAGITLVSAELAMIPMAMTRKLGAVANFQAAFGGTVIHLFVTFAAGAGAYALRLAGDQKIYLFLLLGFYWISLVLVVIAMSRAFRRVIPHAEPNAASAAGVKSA